MWKTDPRLLGSKKHILTVTPPNTEKTLLNEFILYKSKSKFYMVASNTNDSRHRMLKTKTNSMSNIMISRAPGGR